MRNAISRPPARVEAESPFDEARRLNARSIDATVAAVRIGMMSLALEHGLLIAERELLVDCPPANPLNDDDGQTCYARPT